MNGAHQENTERPFPVAGDTELLGIRHMGQNCKQVLQTVVWPQLWAIRHEVELILGTMSAGKGEATEPQRG